MKTQRNCLILIAAIALWPARPAPAKDPAPTLEISTRLEVNQNARSPDEEWVENIIGWKTTHATEVFLLGHDAKKYAPNDEIRSGGPMIVIAVGPGGKTSRLAGCSHKSKAGPGRWGQIHSNVPGFDDSFYFQNAAKREFASRKASAQMVQIICQVLSSRGFSCNYIPAEKAKDTQIIHTLNYEPLASLAQTEEDRRKEGLVQRQAAFTVSLRGAAGSNGDMNFTVMVRPFVRMNHPKDNSAWEETTPDTAMKEVESILQSILKEAAK